jgi:hypothetical protein
MRALAGVVAASAAVVSAVGPARADADSLVDHLGPREIAVGESRRASAVGAMAVSLNPAGLPLTRELVFEGGYGYRASDSASLVGVSACDSTTAMPGCFFYQYVNASPEIGGMESHRRAHTAGLTLSKSLADRVILGTAVRYFDYESDVMDEEDSSGINWDLGATAKLTDHINLGVVGYNLWGADSVQYPRAVGAGALINPVTPLSLSVDGVWNLDSDESTGRYGGGAEWFFSGSGGQTGYPIRAGAVHDVALDGTFLTAGLGLTTMKVGFDVGGRMQVDGGDEKLVIASLRVFGPRADAGY